MTYADLLPLFGEAAPTVTWPDRPRHLMSFAYRNDAAMELCHQERVDLIVDSGAFTTAKSGRQMDHEGYLSWLRDNAGAITFALSYDVIGDAGASRVNYEKAQASVGDLVPVVPTWHVGSTLEELSLICQDSTVVAVGGAVGADQVPLTSASKGAFYALARQVHAIAAEQGVVLHGLGITGNRLVHGLPWGSVDSSTWRIGGRYASVPLTTKDGRIVQPEHGRPIPGWAKELVRDYGGDPDVMQEPGWSLKATVGEKLGRERYEWLVHAGARAFMYLEAYKAAHQPGSPIRVYLSGSGERVVREILQAHAAGAPWGA